MIEMGVHDTAYTAIPRRKPRRKCASCHHERTIVAHGKCTSCYYRSRHHGAVGNQTIQPSLLISGDVIPWRGSLEISHAFHWLLGAGLFVRLNDGQDFYNIGFVNRRRATMYGVMLDVSGSDLYRRRDPTLP